MKKPVSDVLLLMLGLTVLLAIVMDGRRTRKSAGKQLSYSSYKSNKPQLKRGLICGGIDSLGDRPGQLRPARRFSAARANNLRDYADRLAIEAKAAQRLIDYANENPDTDDFTDTANYSEDTTKDLDDATDDSQDDAGDSEEGDADDCVE